MVDLIVPSGAVLTIDTSYTVAPHYGVFRMEANAQIVVKTNLVLKADQAEFGDNCIIDARGAAGADGANGGPATVFGGGGSDGAAGLAGQNGYSLTLEAALEQVGGLAILADGGTGGRGGVGGPGGRAVPGTPPGLGGAGGQGGDGGDGGQISLTWTRAARGLPRSAGAAPNGHLYRSYGGLAGSPGVGGQSGQDVFGNVLMPPGRNGSPGADGKSGALAVIWLPDLASMLWVQAQDMGPVARNGHGMAFDPGRGKLVLFGGLVGGSNASDTWEWDGRLWTQVADTGPSARAYHGMAYDPVGQRVLVFGGASAAQGPYLNDTWSWDGESWIQLADTGPSQRRAPAMAADPARQRVTLFGGAEVGGQGANEENPVADTWEWDGDVWTQVADTGPSARRSACLAYDAGAAALVLFGGIVAGIGPGTAPDDTWAWDGLRWQQVADTGPGGRVGHAMAALGSAVVLFGGSFANKTLLGDTWAWRSGEWLQI